MGERTGDAELDAAGAGASSAAAGDAGAGTGAVAGTAGKYARVERERRFLLARAPAPDTVVAARRITDRYVDGTRLRLRRVERLDTGECTYKLTQKVPAPPGAPGAMQGLITNLYLTEQEYGRLLAGLPGRELAKTRLGLPAPCPLAPGATAFGVDVFEGALRGLVLAEAEFENAEDAETFVPPSGCLAELTHDRRFTGGRLACTDRATLRGLLAAYRVSLPGA